jgi:NADH-quinone oxidoreductase subunit G
MGYGRDISRYTERKRIVKDKNLGPLVSTDMTRCIHCTRCVRFGEEVQGIQELGTTGRGENMRIGTYIEHSVDHELSGNIIDLCPVGALNNKPYRYSARSWEMVQQPLVGGHDCVGSNLFAHTLRGTIKRIVPRPNEAINETWISDRDRFSYEGIYSEARLQVPRVRDDSGWRDASWEEALKAAADALGETGEGRTGILASPSATLEEGYLLGRIAEHIGTANIDYRLRRRDVRDQGADPVYPFLGMPLAELDRLDAALLVGSNVRKEAPIVAHRLRKSAVSGGRVSVVSHRELELYFPVVAQATDGLVRDLSAVARALSDASGRALPAAVESLADGAQVTDAHRAIAASLTAGERKLILLGNVAGAHEAFTELRTIAAAVAALCGATLGYLSDGANAAGLSLAGVTPHRTLKGVPREEAGLAAGEMLDAGLDSYVLLNVDPEADLAAFGAAAATGLGSAKHVIAITPFMTDSIAATATIALPAGSFAETAGTFVNVEGRWQRWQGVATPVGESRPAWKVLRVLGNLLEVPGFDFVDADQLHAAVRDAIGDVGADNAYGGVPATRSVNGADSPERALDVPIYHVDAIVRHARALQLTADGRAAAGWPASGGGAA